MPTGTNRSAIENGCRSAAIRRKSGTIESAKLTRFEPTTESGKTACGTRTLRIRSWFDRIELSPCRSAVLKKSQGSRADKRKMEKFRCEFGMMVVKTTV